jgi:antitoxin (DNA-binding transcriptional repressor) of toxin-antitoxin stability system
MEIVNIKRAKAEFDDLFDRAEAGEEIIIARWRKPIARLVSELDGVDDNSRSVFLKPY